jgi:hypothetical protein
VMTRALSPSCSQMVPMRMDSIKYIANRNQITAGARMALMKPRCFGGECKKIVATSKQ